jgi:hypothetical protein
MKLKSNNPKNPNLLGLSSKTALLLLWSLSAATAFGQQKTTWWFPMKT